jgi:hypothetical protein
MPLARLSLPAVAALATLALAGCGGMVASDAPPLLTQEELATRTAGTEDTTRGAQAASTLAWRAAQLRANAARMRREGISDAERQSLLRRADALKEQ